MDPPVIDPTNIRDLAPFEAELSAVLQSRAPASASRVAALTKLAMRHREHYKAVVHLVATFIKRAPPEYKLSGLYFVDSICRAALADGKRKPKDDPYVTRFEANLPQLTAELVKCPEKDRQRIKRLIDVWRERNVFPAEFLDKAEAKWVRHETSASSSAATPVQPVAPTAIPQIIIPGVTPGAVPAAPVAAGAAPIIDTSALALSLGSLANPAAPTVPAANPPDLSSMLANLGSTIKAQHANSPAPGAPLNPLAGAGGGGAPAEANPLGGLNLAALQQLVPGLANLAAAAGGAANPDVLAPLAHLAVAAAQLQQNQNHQHSPAHFPAVFNQQHHQQRGSAAAGMPFGTGNGSTGTPNAYGGHGHGHDHGHMPNLPAGFESDPAFGGSAPPPPRRYGAGAGAGGPGGNRPNPLTAMSPEELRACEDSLQVNWRATPVNKPDGPWIQIEGGCAPNQIKVMSRTLYIGGIVKDISRSMLEQLFGQFGKVTSVMINYSKFNCFLKMHTRREANEARKQLDHYDYSLPSGETTLLKVKWGCGFGPKPIFDYDAGVSVLDIDRQMDRHDHKFMMTSAAGGIRSGPLRGGITVEEPDIDPLEIKRFKLANPKYRPEPGTGTGGGIGLRANFEPVVGGADGNGNGGGYHHGHAFGNGNGNGDDRARTYGVPGLPRPPAAPPAADGFGYGGGERDRDRDYPAPPPRHDPRMAGNGGGGVAFDPRRGSVASTGSLAPVPADPRRG
ncbi:hypothetical protein H9P43_005831 [Blastocladiella emersonii ATCC 22665]|nr:hypothetical protein H9P43_005831 [Blastocladiella emersonii ATCC 22665]